RLAQGEEEVGHLFPRLQVQVPRGLVGEEDGGVQGQGPGQSHPLLFPAGEAAWQMVTVLATRSPPTTRATRLMPKRTRSLILRARSAKRITSLVVWAFTPKTASSKARATASAFWPGLRATSTAVTFSVPKASWTALRGTKIRLSARSPV